MAPLLLRSLEVLVDPYTPQPPVALPVKAHSTVDLTESIIENNSRIRLLRFTDSDRQRTDIEDGRNRHCSDDLHIFCHDAFDLSSYTRDSL